MELLKTQSLKNINHPFFGTEEFLSIKSDQYGWLKEGDYCIPFFIDKKLIFKRLIFTNTPFHIDTGKSLTGQKSFLNHSIDFIKNNLKVDFIAKSLANVVFDEAPNNSISATWGSYFCDIQKNDEELISKFKSRTRSKVRKAIRDGVIIKETDYLTAYEIISNTFSRQKEDALIPTKIFLKKLTDSKNVLTLKAEYNEKLQGVIIVCFDSSNAYYYYGGSIIKPHNGSLFLLHYEAMKLLREIGVKNYDFMGARLNLNENSKYYGIQRFKEQFGPKLVIGFSFKFIINPLKYRLFELSVKIFYLKSGKKYEGDPIDQILRNERYNK